MKIEKNAHGIYVARISTTEGQRSIKLGTGDRAVANQVVKQSKLHEIELLAKVKGVHKSVIRKLVLADNPLPETALAQFEAWLGTRRTPRHVRNSMIILRRFVRDAKLDTTPVNDITDRDVDRWINTASDCKASTLEIWLSTLKKFFDYCTNRQYAITNPAADVRVRMENLRHAQKETKVVAAFTEPEYGEILTEMDCRIKSIQSEVDSASRRINDAKIKNEYTKPLECRLESMKSRLSDIKFWKLASEIAWQTGLRLGDICQLEWASVHGNRITVWTDKTNSRVELKISPGLAYELKNWTRADRLFVFPDQRSTYIDPNLSSTLSKDFGRIAKKAGVRKTFHSFRHAYATRAKQQGMPLEHIRQRLGHSSVAMTEHYAK